MVQLVRKNLVSKFNSAPNGIGLIKVNNVVLSEDKEMADALNNKFQPVLTLENENNITALRCQSVGNQ